MLRTLRTSLEHGVYLSSVAYNTRAQLAIFMRTLSSAPDQEAPRSLKVRSLICALCHIHCAVCIAQMWDETYSKRVTMTAFGSAHEL